MRTTRKLLALLLAVAMVFTMTAMTALATGGDDGTTTPDGDTTPGGGTTTPDGGPATPGDPTTPEVSAEAQAVINLIAALPEFDTLDSDEAVEAFKAQVSAARAAYNELTLEQQVEVTNDETLTQAEANLASLELIKPLGNEAVCQIGTTRYPTLQAAVDAVQGDLTLNNSTIILTADTKENVTIPAGVTITLDLASHEITNQNDHTITVKNGATLTIKDTSAGGTVDNITHAKAAIWNEGTVTLNGGSYTRSQENGQSSSNAGGNSYYALVNHGTMTINSGVSVTQDGNFSSMIENGYYNYKSLDATSGYVAGTNSQNPTLTIYGGNFSGGLNTVKNDDGGILTINGGTFKNVSQAVVQNHNKATINGGMFTATGNTTYAVDNCGCAKEHDVGTLTITNGTFTANIAVYDRSALPTTTVNITGGSFNGTEAAIKTKGDSKATITVSGGTFSSDIEKKYLAENLETKQDDNGNYVVGDAAAVAKIGDETYSSLAEALKDAKSGETVTLLKSITVNKWNQAWNLKGITLDGGGNTITVNAIESLQNHDAVFHSAGGNTFKDLIVDLSDITQSSHAQGNRAFAAAAGDTFRNVTIKGSDAVSYGITISGKKASNETVTIDGCTIKNCDYAIYDSETGDVEKLIIQNSIITGCDYATILHSPNGQFINNQVTGGKLNIMEENQTITENTFDDSRIKFYDEPKEFKRNKISKDSHLDKDDNLTDTIDVSKNYWGGGKPTKDQLGNIDSVTGTDVYYVKDTMRPQDLNTYTPPSGGGSGSGSLPVILLSPVWNQTVSVIEHGTLTMSVRASGASSYQWFVDRGDGRGFVAITGATGPSLTIWPDMGDNGNRYYCQAKNGYGGVNSPYFTLCVVRSTLPPKTGDQVSVTLWVCLMALGVAGALTAWNRQRNR